MRKTAIINIMMTLRGIGREPNQSAMMKGILVTAKKCPRMVAPARRISIMPAIASEFIIDSIRPFRLISFLRSTRMNTAKAPTLPASVGTKNPIIRPPTTRTKMPMIHTIGRDDPILSLHVDLSPLGPMLGLILHHP